MKVVESYMIFPDWLIAYNRIWCGDQGVISDTKGTEPDITFEDCKRKCEKEASCNFMLFGIKVWSLKVNRCTLFETCDDRTEYSGNYPIVYIRPFTGSNQYTNRFYESQFYKNAFPHTLIEYMIFLRKVVMS